MKKRILLINLFIVVSTSLFATAPTVPANYLSFSNKTTTSVKLNWTNGNGVRRLITVRPYGYTREVPATSTTTLYSDSKVYGNSNNILGSIANKNYVVNNSGTDGSFTVTNLAANTQYTVTIYECNFVSPNYQYLISSYEEASFYTLDAEPTVTTTGLSSYSIGATTAKAVWTNGDGDNRMAIVKQGAPETAISFDGTNDYITVPNIAAIKPTAAVSVEFWAYQTDWISTQNNNDPTLIGNAETGGWSLTITNDSIDVYMRLNGAYRRLKYPASALNAGWHHFAFTCDGRYTTLYIDGAQKKLDDAGATYTISYNATNSLIIGAEASSGSTPSSGKYFKGKLDDIRIWNTERSASSIVSYMVRSLDGTESGLVGYWSLDDNGLGGTTVNNLCTATSGINGTLTNSSSSAASNFTANTGWTYSSAPVDLPTDGFYYAASSAYPSGSTVGNNGGEVVYSSTGNGCAISGLTANTDYYIKVVEYNGVPTNYNANFNITAFEFEKFTTTIAEPTTAASALTFSGVTGNSITASWTIGNGTNRIVQVRQDEARTALSFDGTNDYVSIPNESNFDFSTEMTAEAWIKVNSFSMASQMVLGKGYSWYIRRNGSTNALEFVIFDGTAYRYASGTRDVNDGKWHHVAGTFDGTSINLYIDGVLDVSTALSSTTIYNSAYNVYIGANQYFSGNYFNGQIDEVRLWSKERLASVIPLNMYANVGNSQNGLIGYYKFDDGNFATSTAISSSTNSTGVDGTLNNMTTTAAANFTSTSGWVYSGANIDSPKDNTAYAANTILGSGTSLSDGYSCVYNSTGTSVTVTGLTPGMRYNFAVTEYNSTSGYLNYLTSSYLTGTQATSNVAPTLNAISNPAPICQNASAQTVSLSGIGTGGETQTLTVTATSSNTALIPNPTVTYTSANTTGSLTYTPVNGASGTAIITATVNDGTQSNNTVSKTFTVSVNPLPVTPGSVSGTATVCQGQTSVNYSVAAIANATGYTWTLPTGASITAGSGTNSITVSYSNSATSGNVTVTGTNACGNGPTSTAFAVTVNPLPSAAGAITGSTTTCQGKTGVTYSIAAVSNATGYVWSLPSGASITSGSGTNSIVVSFSNSATSGNVNVYATNACGNGTVSSNFAVTVAPLPSAAGAISGTFTVCAGQTSVTYSIAAVSNATGYIWSLPSGASITAGTNTNSITVSYSNSATSGTINVYATNACGNGTASSNYTVVVNPLPSSALSITGTSTVCQGQASVLYKISSLSNTTTYVWTVPSGASIVGNSNNDTIYVTYSNSASSGNITVKGQNSCGYSIATATLAVTVNPLPSAASTITGSATVCQGQTSIAYFVTAINNASAYVWSLPSGASITSGAGTNNVVVSFSNSATSGNITVYGTNACGNGTVSSNYAVTVNPLPSAAGAITGTATVCQGQTSVNYSVTAISNATGYVWSLPSGASITAGSNTNSITVSYSASASSGNVNVYATNTCGNGSISSNYAVTVNPLPSAAGSITGTSTVCQGQTGIAYSVAAISNATGYTWTGPTGISIATGVNTRNITANFSAAAVSGNVTVTGTNACGSGTTSANYALTVNPLPSAAGTITGSASVCQSQTGVMYSITSPANATGYAWTLPSGVSYAAGTASNNDTIYVNFSASATSNSISVVGTNTCGNGTSGSKSITVNPLPSASGVITGTATVCEGSNNVAYSVASINNATTYNWSLPSGASIATGTGTRNITVNFANGASSGNITVYASNTCGVGTTSANYAVSIDSKPTTANAGSDQSICSSIAPLAANTPAIGSGLWSIVSGSCSFNSSTSPTTNATGIATPSTVKLEWKISNGVCTPSRDTVTISGVVCTTNADFFPSTYTACAGDTITYTDNSIGANAWTWTFTGATPSSATGVGPHKVVYATSGSKSASLSISGPGGSDSESKTNLLTITPLPDAAGVISGTNTVCQGDDQVAYSVVSIPNATSYTWTLPTGVTLNTGLGSNIVTLDYGSYAGTPKTIKVQGVNACGVGTLSPAYNVTVNPKPDATDTIYVPASICQGQQNVAITTPAVANASAYTWVLPTGFSYVSGSGTNSIVINVSAGATSDTIRAKGVNSCGSRTIYKQPITINTLPSAAGSISGTATVCQGQTGVVFSVGSIAGATSYTWTLPSGATVTAGTNTNSITVSFSNSASSGNVTVAGTNSCGNGTVSSSFAVTVNALPSAASSITGTPTVCQNQTAVSFSVSAISNATAYLWSFPSGATITSANNINSIIVDFNSSAQSGNVTVTGTNACGSGTISSNYALTVNPLPGNAGAISGTATVCAGANNVMYMVNAISNTTTYHWTLPSGASTSSSNSDMIDVDFSTSASAGNITVYGENACGNGAVSANYTVTVNPLPAQPIGISGSSTVCQGQTSVSFSVASTLNATSYTWTLPTGASIASGANANSITVNFSNSAQSGNVSVAGVNSCGTGVASSAFAITVNPLPSAASVISGSPVVCASQSNVTFSVSTINNASDYLWTLPNGATITSATNINSIIVDFSNSAQSGNVTVSGINACGSGTTSANYNLTVNPLPDNAQTITGSATVCQGQNNVQYIVPEIDYATTYHWSLPAGASSSNTNNDTIFVNYATNASIGNITVYASNSCGDGAISTNYPIAVNVLPSQPSGVSGAASVCQGEQGVPYQANAAANSDYYVWNLPAGASISSGDSTTSVVINFANSVQNNSISVSGVNTCGIGSASTALSFTVNPLPSNAGGVAGLTSVCQNQTGVNYFVSTINNADSYVWTLPNGVSITSGDTTNSIVVDFDVNALSGNIQVQGLNSCGLGNLSSGYLVTVNPLPANASAINGLTTVCENQTQVEYVVNTINDASTYNWILPSGAIISGGNGADTIVADYTLGSQTGTISVNGTNICGDGVASSATINVNRLPASAMGISGSISINLCPAPTTNLYVADSIANADYYLWNLPFGSAIISGDSTNAIVVDLPNNTLNGQISVQGVNGCGVGSPSSLTVSINGIPTPSVCVVTVDPTLNKNVIVWDKSGLTGITAFNVYRETSSAGVYSIMTTVPFDSLSSVIDPIANPDVRSYRYKIAALDSCSNESVLSAEHKTIHVVASPGTVFPWVNLTIEGYEGFSYLRYIISRGIDRNSMVVIDTIPSTNLTYTDQNPPLSDSLFYFVEVETPGMCSATRANNNYNSAKSNTAGIINAPVGLGVINEKTIQLYPNPAQNELFVGYSADIATIEIYNELGQLLTRLKTNETLKHKIDVSGYNIGVYNIRFIAKQYTINRKFVKME